MLQSKAGYIDARPLTTRSTKTSCNARPDHTSGSECEILYASRCFPLRLQTQTFLDAVGTSHLCQKPTLAIWICMRAASSGNQVERTLSFFFARPATKFSVS